MDGDAALEPTVGEREKFEFEKSIRERELRLKEIEAERAEKARLDAIDKDRRDNRLGAQIIKMLPAMVPLFVVLVASYFAYKQFVQSQQYTSEAQSRAALYTAATEQYKVVLGTKIGLLKRKDTALDELNENVKTIRGLIDGPEFLTSDAYRSARRKFYVIESSDMPLIKTPELEDAVGLFEKGFNRSERLARGGRGMPASKDTVPDDYDALNNDWGALQQRFHGSNAVRPLPRGYADMMGYLATGVNEFVEEAHIRNANPDQFGTVKEIFDQIAGSTVMSH